MSLPNLEGKRLSKKGFEKAFDKRVSCIVKCRRQAGTSEFCTNFVTFNGI